MRKLLFYFTFSFVLFACCNEPVPGGPDKPGTVPFIKGEKVSRTLLVYLMAENSLTGDLQADFDEIKVAASSLSDDVRLFVYFDNSDATRLPTLYQYHPYKGELIENVVYAFENDVCSSDTTVLGKVLDVIFNDYPTESMDIVMGSHADGWIRNKEKSAPNRIIGVDNGKNTYSNNITTTIEIEELAELLERMPVKVDRLMFDACLMQCVEVAYALRNSADWIIASPAEIPAYGAPYDKVVPEFLADDTSVLDIMKEYNAFYDSANTGGVVLTAIKTCNIQELADVTRKYVIRYFSPDCHNDYGGLFSYLPGGYYDSYPSYTDINSVMGYFLLPDEYLEWKSVFDKAVPYLVTSNVNYFFSGILRRMVEIDVDACSGVSIYLPHYGTYGSIFNGQFKTTEWYTAAGWSEAGW